MCDYRTLIIRLIDGQVDAGDRRRAEEHLMSCADCAGRHADLLRMRVLISQLPAVMAPVGLAPKVMARLAAEKRWLSPADSWLDRRRPAESASLAVALCLVWLLIVLPVGGLIYSKAQASSPLSLARVKVAGGTAEHRLSAAIDRLNASLGGGK